MPSDNFWGKALNARAQAEPEPAPLSAGDVELSNWGEQRSALGIADSGDFIGVSAWKRPQRYVHHEPTAMENWAAERQSLGIKDAPQSSAGNVRDNMGAYRALIDNSPRRNK